MGGVVGSMVGNMEGSNMGGSMVVSTAGVGSIRMGIWSGLFSRLSRGVVLLCRGVCLLDTPGLGLGYWDRSGREDI